MLFLLLCARRDLGAPLPYPVHRGDCEAILNTSHYNLRVFQNRLPDQFTTSGNVRYIARMCEQTNKKRRNADFDDTFLMRCTNLTCESCITQNSLDYKPLNPKKFSEGVIYYAEGEPFHDENGHLRTVDIEWRIICDESVTDPNAKAEFTVIEGDNLTGLVTGTIRHAAGCPTTQPPPSPSPNYAPNCYFEERYDQDKTKGVKVDLTDLNDGPFGVKSTIIVDGAERNLYFQTCERMTCPPGYSCPEEPFNLSSAWVCDTDKDECVSWGVGVEQPIFKPVDQNLKNGMKLDLENPFNGKSISLKLLCKAGYPEGHIDWHKDTVVSGNHMDIVGLTSAVCVQRMPSPTPPPIGGQCSFKGQIGDATVSMNLEKLNKGQEGWSKVVDVQGVVGFPDSKLMFQPCGAMPCPDGTYCSGDEDATVWLCFTDEGEKKCEGYGLWENNLSMEFWNPGNPDYGVKATYKGDMKRTTEVQFICNKSLGPSELLLPNYVTISQSKMTVIVQAEDACPASPTPPPETWHPPIPKKGSTPTPTPDPSPNPDFVVFNETKYVKLNLDMMLQSEYIDTLELYSGTEESQCSARIKWHPWKLLTPPEGYPPGEFDFANMWVCWTDESIGRYCHPVGDKRMGIDMRLMNDGDYGRGMTLTYDGAYGLNLEVDVHCNEAEVDHQIPFDHMTKLAYVQSLQGPKILVDTDSSEVCPRSYLVPTPPPTPSPSPEPTGSPVLYFETTLDGKTGVADFYSMGYHHQRVLVGHDDKYELDMIYFDATNKIPCPDGYKCLGEAQESNVWRCINGDTCISMAHTEFGIDYKLIDPSTVEHGISATFGGSYAETLVVNCMCDEMRHGFRFDDLVDRTPYGNSVKLTIRSRGFCKSRLSPLSGGAVFLLLVFTVGIVYFGGGIIFMFVMYGTVTIPNAAFWQEFVACIVYVFTFLFGLTRMGATASLEYDKI